MVVAPCLAWDVSRRVPVTRRPAKFHFTNLLAAACWSPSRPRSARDLDALPAEVMGRWLEWAVAQELFRRRCIAGEELPELLLHWQSKEHEVDYLEVERWVTTPVDYAWFERALPRGRLLVVGNASFEARSVRGVYLEEFLRGGEGALGGLPRPDLPQPGVPR